MCASRYQGGDTAHAEPDAGPEGAALIRRNGTVAIRPFKVLAGLTLDDGLGDKAGDDTPGKAHHGDKAPENPRGEHPDAGGEGHVAEAVGEELDLKTQS